MTVLERIRAEGVLREPQFADLGLGHVPFDSLTGRRSLEGPLIDGVLAGSSAAVVGGRGAGKSSVLAWLCREMPTDHIPIRVPVVGMGDPSDPAVLGSVALGAALQAARAGAVDLEAQQRDGLEGARADERVRRPASRAVGGRLGGGPVPAEVSADLGSLQEEHTRGAQPLDRIEGFERLLGVFTYHGLRPVFVLEDTEAALGAGVDEGVRDRFFTNSLKLLVREVEAPTVIAVQSQFTALTAYSDLRAALLEVELPVLTERAVDLVGAVLARRFEIFELDATVGDVVSDDALCLLGDFYREKGGSLRHVLAALDVAAATALSSGDERLAAGHVRVGTEDWRER